MADGRRQRTEGDSQAAAIEPACHVLEDGSRVADDDNRTADEEPPAMCCVDGVTRQLTRRRVSCSHSPTGKHSFRSRSLPYRFVCTTYNVVRRFAYVLCQTWTSGFRA